MDVYRDRGNEINLVNQAIAGMKDPRVTGPGWTVVAVGAGAVAVGAAFGGYRLVGAVSGAVGLWAGAVALKDVRARLAERGRSWFARP